MTPDWKLPAGVDRGLWDYLHNGAMAADYDELMAATPLAAIDVAFCEKQFERPGRLLDLGCGTGRLCERMAFRGFECVGVDLSPEMLARTQKSANITWLHANIAEPLPLTDASFDYAACLFSTLGMVRSLAHRQAVLENAYRLLKPGGRFVVHVHNRWHAPLGWRRFFAAEFTMPQAHGGAMLSIHHFTRRGILRMLAKAGFAEMDVQPIGVNEKLATGWWRVYGYLIGASKPVQ